MKMRWPGSRSQGALGQLAYALALVGAVVMILLSLASFLGLAITLPVHVPIAAMFGSALIGLILGVVALVGSKHVREFVWAIVLLVIGYVGGGLGGLLVLVGSILGILSRFL